MYKNIGGVYYKKQIDKNIKFMYVLFNINFIIEWSYEKKYFKYTNTKSVNYNHYS